MTPELILAVVALATPVAYIAYTHPEAYKKLFPYVLAIYVVVVLMMFSYNVGVSTSQLATAKFLFEQCQAKKTCESLPGFQELNSVEDSVSISYWWMMIGCSSIWAFMCALAYLPNLGITANKRNPPPKG